MAIQTAGELEVTLTDILMKVDRVLQDQPRHAALQAARRSLGGIAQSVKRKEKLGPRQLEGLATVAETLRSALSDDEALADQLFDVRDFLERP